MTLSPSSNTNSDRFERIVDRFESRWRDGSPLDLAAVAAEFDGPEDQRRGLLCELAAVDLEYRWRRRVSDSTTAPMLDDYLRRFPELGDATNVPAEFVAEEFRIRRRFGDRPTIDSYQRRFSQRWEEIRPLLKRAAAEIDRETPADGKKRRGRWDETFVLDSGGDASGSANENSGDQNAGNGATGVEGETPSDSPSVDDVIRAGLVPAEHVDALRNAHGGDAGDHTVIASLIESGRVTAWQLSQLHKGRTNLVLDGGRYVVLDVIGRGGMGSVYRARHTRMNSDVALKVMDLREGRDAAFLGRFRREVEISSRLVHEHVVRALDVGEHDGTWFLVMEYVKGANLSSIVGSNGPMPPDEAVAVALQAASGLAYAHSRGVVHRDVKPQNILLSTAGVTKILDLGLARLIDEAADDHTALRQEGAVMGTVDYMAPEQGRDTHAADARCDVYSLGATLYYLLAGRPPFAGGTAVEKLHRLANEKPAPLGEIHPGLPRELTNVVERMMSKRPADRYQTMEDVVRALRPFAAERIAGRAVVTAAVQSAAETHRAASPSALTHSDAPTVVAGSSFVPHDAPVTEMLRRRKPPPSPVKLLLPGAVIAAILIAAAVWATRGPSSKPDEPSVESAGGNAVAATPVPPEEFRAVLPAHFGKIHTVEWSPTGLYLATGGADGDVRVWDVGTRKTVEIYRGHDAAIADVEWSPDGESIASVDHFGGVHVWRTAGAALVRQWDLRLDSKVDYEDDLIAFSPDGRELAYGSGARLYRLQIDRAQPAAIRRADVDRVAFTADGMKIVGGRKDHRGGVRVWPRSLEGEPRRLTSDDAACAFTTLSGERMALIAADGVRVFDTRTLELTREQKFRGFTLRGAGQHQRPVVTVFESGAVFGWATADEIVRIDLETGEATPLGNRSQRIIDDWAVSPQQDRWVLLNQGSLVLGSVAGTEPSQWLRKNQIAEGVEAPKVFGDRYVQWIGRYSSQSGRCWDLETGRIVPNFPRHAHVREAESVAWAIREERIDVVPLPGSKERSRLLVRLDDSADYLSPNLPDQNVGWLDAGRFVFCKSRDHQTVRMWTTADGAVRETLTAGEGKRFGAAKAVSSDSTLAVVVADVIGRLRLWRAADGETTDVEVKMSYFFNRGVAVSADGRLVAGARGFRDEDDVYLFDVARSRILGELNPQESPVGNQVNLEFSSDDALLLVDHHIFNPKNRERLWTCPEHGRARGDYWDFTSGALFADGRHVAVALDLQIQIWNWRENRKRATIQILPDDEWAFFNHETGCWRGSPLAFTYLRFRHVDKEGREKWLNPKQWERTTDWKNDPEKAGLLGDG